jgi:branched-chain amino acid transport system permease protein
MGIPVQRASTRLRSALAAAVAAFARHPAGADHLRARQHGLHRARRRFPAAVVGGFGSLPGAIVGGLVIGVVESLSGLLPARRLQGHRAPTSWCSLMLMVQPSGLFGEKLRKKV